VGVSVGEAVGATVAVSVGEGSGVPVQVGAGVGVGEAMNCTPPHPRSRRASPENQIKCFRKLLQWMVQIPENPQTFECEPGRDDLDHIRFLRDDGGKSPRRDDLHFGPQFVAETLDHAFHHAHVAE